MVEFTHRGQVMTMENRWGLARAELVQRVMETCATVCVVWLTV